VDAKYYLKNTFTKKGILSKAFSFFFRKSVANILKIDQTTKLQQKINRQQNR